MIKKVIIITGGLGFIGSNFVNYLDKKLKNYKLVIIDKKKKYNKSFFKLKNNKIEIIFANTINIKKSFQVIRILKYCFTLVSSLVL